MWHTAGSGLHADVAYRRQKTPSIKKHSENNMSKEWPLWEVFIRSQHGLAHKHVGSLHAPDAEMAVNNARDVYTRRNEGVSIWVVKASDIVASSPADKGPLFEPSNSKVYRHPTFFPMPEEVKNL
jgi:ring-1,2-phenylacetyl-CoA epoxidase subunit PaaB